jgi:hypothetical protein
MSRAPGEQAMPFIDVQSDSEGPQIKCVASGVPGINECNENDEKVNFSCFYEPDDERNELGQETPNYGAVCTCFEKEKDEYISTPNV